MSGRDKDLDKELNELSALITRINESKKEIKKQLCPECKEKNIDECVHAYYPLSLPKPTL